MKFNDFHHRHAVRRNSALRQSRLGQGLEQVEPRVMLAGDAVISTPIEVRSASEGGYIDLRGITNGFVQSGTKSILESADVIFPSDAGLSQAWNSTPSLPFVHGNSQPMLPQPELSPASEGGLAYIPLRSAEPIESGVLLPGSRGVIATAAPGPISPAVRPTIQSELPLEAARGRSQAFELSVRRQDSSRSTALVAMQAVDAAMADFGNMQQDLAVVKSLRSQPNRSSAVQVQANATASSQQTHVEIPGQQVAAAQLAAPVDQAASLSLPAAAAPLALSEKMVASEDRTLAAEGAPSAEPTTGWADADFIRHTLMTPLLAFENTSITSMPGMWLFAVVVSLTGLHWQKSGRHAPARESEAMQPRLRHVAVTGRRAS